MGVPDKIDLPGRLGEPDLELRNDPRADPRMLRLMDSIGLLESAAPPVSVHTSYEEILAFLELAEESYETLNDTVTSSWPPIKGVSREKLTITGEDENEISLYIHRSDKASKVLPGILHLHGGGMCLMSATGSMYDRWCAELAATGLVVVSVEFRNSAGKLGPFPFPAGLNDCTSALYWMDEHRTELDISGIVISGESGGGNLSIASCLKAKRDNRITAVSGVYAQCPAVSNRYVNKDPSLPSLFDFTLI